MTTFLKNQTNWKAKQFTRYSFEEIEQIFNTVYKEVHTFVPIGTEVESERTKRAGITKYWKIIKVGNHTEIYQFFDDMLKAFDRDDLEKLWSLVKEKFNLTEPINDKERVLWVEMKRIFEPYVNDELWKF
ncbi:hypothetical protein Tco_1177074 [Tanacetum coccineum]